MTQQAIFTDDQFNKIAAFILKTKWPPEMLGEAETRQHLFDIMEGFNWNVEKASTFHLHNDRIKALSENQRTLIANVH